MGYYNGNGETTGGSSTTSVYQHFVWNGAHNIYQMHTVSVNRKGGVSLATCQSKQAECNMVTHQFTWGLNYYWSPNCKGNTKNFQYSQIGGSNLYELVETSDVIKAKLDEQGWVS